MTITIPDWLIPGWLPWWAPIVVLAPAALWFLMFLLVPFSVLGVRGRLDAIEARLDEIQGEIRALTLRLPERIVEVDDLARRGPVPPRMLSGQESQSEQELRRQQEMRRTVQTMRPRRVEPKLD